MESSYISPEYAERLERLAHTLLGQYATEAALESYAEIADICPDIAGRDIGGRWTDQGEYLPRE